MFRSPSPGDDAAPLVDSAATWRVLTEMMNRYLAGDFDQPSSKPARYVRAQNKTGGAVEGGELLHIDTNPEPSSDIAESWYRQPIVEAVRPAWHDSVDNLFVCPYHQINDEFVEIRNERWAMVQMSATSSGLGYGFPDPAEPWKLKASSSGIYRIMGSDSTSGMAFVDMTRSQNLWRYKLMQDSQAPGKTKAALKDVDNNAFSDEGNAAEWIDLSDPLGLMDDQVTDDVGYCIYANNSFYALQATC